MSETTRQKNRQAQAQQAEARLADLPPLAHAIAQVAFLGGVAQEVAALLTGDARILARSDGGYASLTGTATSVAHDHQEESKSWEDGRNPRPECSGRIEMKATVSPGGEQSLLMKQVAERLSATRQKRRRKDE